MKEDPQEWENAKASAAAPYESPGRRTSWVNTAVMIAVVVLLAMIIAGLSAPLVLRSAKSSERTMAINHAKQIGLMLLEFDQEFGSFPGVETVAAVKATTETDLDLSGESSNALFRQLIAHRRSSEVYEELFFVPKHPECRRKPDRKVIPGKALEPGELGWSYLMLDSAIAQNTSDNPGRAVLAAPMKIGTDRFWPDAFGSKAVILRLDNSVDAPLIRGTDGKVSVGNGKTLTDTGSGTVWGDDKPDIRHPEPGGE